MTRMVSQKTKVKLMWLKLSSSRIPLLWPRWESSLICVCRVNPRKTCDIQDNLTESEEEVFVLVEEQRVGFTRKHLGRTEGIQNVLESHKRKRSRKKHLCESGGLVSGVPEWNWSDVREVSHGLGF